MSTKSSIFLTNDNEHCYEECNDRIYDENKNFLGYEINLEIDLKHASYYIDSEHINICLNDPNSEIYKLIMLLRDKETTIRI